jgi:gluconate 2-dehydrogenase subunit 3-like protein
MKKKWTRRKFLRTGVKASVVISAGVVGKVSRANVNLAPESPAMGLDLGRGEALRAAMDEIIPAVDGMPAASEVGGVEYLDRLAQESREIKVDLEKSLTALERASRKKFHRSFTSLSHSDRIKALSELEKQPELFATLRDFTYEAYYTQPRIWKLIGYEFYPTNQAGPHMKPFDESVLAKVRKMPRLYREVE